VASGAVAGNSVESSGVVGTTSGVAGNSSSETRPRSSFLDLVLNPDESESSVSQGKRKREDNYNDESESSVSQGKRRRIDSHNESESAVNQGLVIRDH
jgi:hypothetical protein